MKNVYAFVVGISQYAQKDWTIKGPSENALAVTQWLLDLQVPPINISLFIDTNDQNLDSDIRKFEELKIDVRRTATFEPLDTFWRDELPNKGQAGSRLFVYWSGHGFADNDGQRIFICRDYTDQSLKNRVFNCSNVLRHLRSPGYQRFSQQILLSDACAVHANVPIVPDKVAPDNQVKDTQQIAFFASPELEYAKGNNGRGVFTNIALDVLKGFDTWPDLTKLRNEMLNGFNRKDLPLFRIGYRVNDEEQDDYRVGSIPHPLRDSLVDSVYNLLNPIKSPDSVYKPHFLRTVRDLGMPELASAQGLGGMIRELASLRDAANPDQPSYGLLQFLLRLQSEPPFKAPIQVWLDARPTIQGNMMANVREKLENEAQTKILIIEVNNDGDKIASYDFFVHSQNLLPLPGIPHSNQAVESWDDFVVKLLKDIAGLEQLHGIVDFQIQFLVNPPLFDHEFHAIPLNDGDGTLGEKHLVFVRHRDRVRMQRNDVTDAWFQYANSIRSTKPSALRLLAIPDIAGPNGVLPGEKGLCYTSFLVQRTRGHESESKKVLLRLLRSGVPYIYWLHAKPDDDCFNKIGPQFTDWLKNVHSLDDFPVLFKMKRVAGNDYARNATLLWDDPQFNPFPKVRNWSVA